MSLTQLFQKTTVRVGISCLLFATILMHVFLPVANMARIHPDNPLEDSSIREISVLQMGESLSNLSNIVVPNGGTAAPKDFEQGNMGPTDQTSEESELEEPEPEEPIPDETEGESEETDGEDDLKDDEGNEDGEDGKEGGSEKEVELAAVMTWYKYGNEPNTIVCTPSGSVAQTVNVAQLVNNNLKYEFQITGQDARYVEIQSISLTHGNSMPNRVSESGSVDIELPNGKDSQDYTFQIKARYHSEHYCCA